MDKRKIGLEWCKQVANILRQDGHVVDGPFSKVIFTKGRKMASHVDIFNTFDIISLKNGVIFLHQVTSLNMLSNKRKKIFKLGIRGIIWCHCKIDEKTGYRRFCIDPLNNLETARSWETSTIII